MPKRMGSVCTGREGARRLADQGLEVADEVRLVEVAELFSDQQTVFAVGKALGGLEQPVALDHPLRTGAEILAEQALQAARAEAKTVHQLLDADHRTIV